MSKTYLTAEEKINMERRHKQVRDIREGDRIKAVLLSSEGWRTAMIAQALRQHESTILRHLEDYYREQKLNCANGGSASYLDDEQTAELVSHLTEQLYSHTHEIAAYIQQRWSIDYSIPGLNKWLHQHGFSYKKPKGLPHKADMAEQEAFIKTYEELKATVSEDEPILFMDAVHPTQATKLSHGWIKTGTDKAIKTTGSRTRLNIIGAIRLGHLAESVTAQYKTVNAEAIMDFMPQLRAQYINAKTLHLILDGAGYHRAKAVDEKANELNIVLHFLPPYSPNLNPIERLWKVMNEHVRNNHYFHSAKEFRERMAAFFETTLPVIADSLNHRINDNFQRFDIASSS
jgi:transposase